MIPLNRQYRNDGRYNGVDFVRPIINNSTKNIHYRVEKVFKRKKYMSE